MKRFLAARTVLLVFVFIYLMTVSLTVHWPALAADARQSSLSTPDDFKTLGKKFDGAATADDIKCHGLRNPRPPGQQPGNEYTKWSAKDPHNQAYKHLKGDKGIKIATAMKIADPTKDAKCLTCHALNIPDN